MCAIFGFYGPRQPDLLQTMSGTLHHRGPDDSGFYESTHCSLGMNRLSIVDVESGNQPVYNRDRSVVAVFNGEIYNFRDLRKELEADGVPFQSHHSDSELIPFLYEKYGLKFVAKINGMFAIALYDTACGKLFLFRDRIGKKPLYYTQPRPSQFYFASEIKALKKIGLCESIRQESLFTYFMKKNTAAPHTIYDGVYQLPPASLLTFDGKQIQEETYWKFSFYGKKEQTINEWEDALYESFNRAIQIRTYSDVEYGCYLSGGVDSGLVAMILAEKTRNLKTFTLGYEEEFSNKQADLHYARWLSEKLGTDHHEYILGAQEVFQELPKVLQAFDEPFSGTISTYFLSKLISDHVKVAFSGDGSDETFGSYKTHRLSALIDGIRNQETDLEHLPEYKEALHLSRFDNHAWRTTFLVFAPEELQQLLGMTLKESPFVTIPHYRSELEQTLESEFKDQLPNQILPFIDRLSMAHSVEVRSPFLDYEFIELASQVPSGHRIRGGNVKEILKSMARKKLPSEILDRKKEGFVLPVYQWIEGAYRSHVRECILSSKMLPMFDLNRDFLERVLNEFDEGKPHHAKIWNLYTLSVWTEGAL